MSSTYYTSLTGMMAASYGLQNASNNVANMKSSGFKRTDVFYSSLGNGSGQNGLGSGVYVGGQSTNFSAGTYQDTGSPSDLAVVGNGFFIVKLQNGELLYTRNGEFGFNNDGLLIDNHSKGLVQGYDKQGGLVPISQFGSKINPGKATHAMDLKGEFIISEEEQDPNVPKDPDPDKSKYLSNEFDINIFDNEGRSHKITLTFEASNSPGENDGKHWKLSKITCSDATVKGDEDEQSLVFDFENGSASQGSNKINFTLNGNQLVTLNFGDSSSGEDSSVQLYKKENSHTKTKIEEKKQDGYHYGKQIEFSFDENGQITYKYDNGQSEEGNYVALALFDELDHTLIQAQDNLFRARNTNGLRIGRPNKENFGTIQPKKLESSNVDSTTEFANIVVLQRMFQACSQIMDIDKQLLEELYKK